MEEKQEAPKEQEGWMQKKWRPMMAIMYMCVCICDFILFPVLFTIVQFWETQAANDAFRQWAPMTLQGGGLFHMAMGAVLGITAWSRGQEKIAGVAANTVTTTTQVSQQTVSQQYTPQYTPQPAAPQYTQAPQTGYGGKLAPPAPYQPEI
jgi:hypothetical protein